MQDLKTGHLLGAAPKAQFWGQVIGASVGAVLSAFIYRVYTRWVTYHFAISHLKEDLADTAEMQRIYHSW